MKQGLRENIIQFSLLVLINMLVGAVIGIERSSFFEYSGSMFSLSSQGLFVGFVLSFGLSKAIANLYTNRLIEFKSKRWLLLFGWLLAFPGVALLLFAQEWWQVVLANVFIGLNQGFCWSSNVLLKIDLVGKRNRGLAMGLNEFSGYFAIGLMSLISGILVAKFGYTFLFGFLFSIVLLGFLLSLFVRDTKGLLALEVEQSNVNPLPNLFKQVTYNNPQLSSVTLNGFVNNLVDGAYWLVLPVMLSKQGYSLEKIGLMASVYPIVWAVAQLFTGKLGDHFCTKQLITLGMYFQVIGLILTAFSGIAFLLLGAVFIGIGTALVYPNFFTELAHSIPPSQRVQGFSYFRFWRDLGYVGGAIVVGFCMSSASIPTILFIVAGLALFSAVIAEKGMSCHKPSLYSRRVN